VLLRPAARDTTNRTALQQAIDRPGQLGIPVGVVPRPYLDRDRVCLKPETGARSIGPAKGPGGET